MNNLMEPDLKDGGIDELKKRKYDSCNINYFNYFYTFNLIVVKGIDFMNENHPDYKGDDLFGDFDENDKDCIL